MLSRTILKVLPVLVGVTILPRAGFAQGIIDQENDPKTLTSFGCGSPPIGLGSLFQSFTPTLPLLVGVELRLKAGGGFPDEGFSTTVRIRLNDPLGEVIAEATTFVPGPLPIGQLLVRYDFIPSVPLTPLDTYVIEGEAAGDAILTWMGRQDDPYPGGHGFGCTGTPNPEQDFNFITFAAVDLDCSDFICGNNDNKALLCHVPPGNPANAHTLCISPKAVADHLENHEGDHCGPCDDGGLAFGLTFTHLAPVDIETCPTDLNADGTVNVLDLIDLLLCFGQPADPGCQTEDVNADGVVNVLDLIELLLNFGQACP